MRSHRRRGCFPLKRWLQSYGIGEDDLELYGKYKAKLTDELWEQVKDRPDGKLVLVTAINPTPAGEGKTTTTVGLGEAFGKMEKKRNHRPAGAVSRARALASREERPAAGTPRWFPWRT